MQKPFSQACENNKGPILSVLKEAFAHTRQVLEIGSGTGQHAIFFAREMPWLRWLPTDRAQHLAGLCAQFEGSALTNLAPPQVLDVQQTPWPVAPVDGVFSANTLHIMAWPAVVAFFAGVASGLAVGGVLCVYGPFNYGGCYTSQSNAQFDQWLKARDPDSGIRDFEAVDAQAQRLGLRLQGDHALPANNRLLVWQRAI